MHFVISSVGEKTVLGGKADNLIKLDKTGFTPDFVSVSAGVMYEEFKDGTPLSSGFVRKIDKALAFLREGPVIVRSSCVCEDSAELSYAGMFSSCVCSKRGDIFDCMRTVWNSRNLERAAAYNRLNKHGRAPDMGVIIQKFIKSNYGGVMFYYGAGEDTVYAEYAPGPVDNIVSGKVLPEYYLQYRRNTFVSSFRECDNSEWIDELAESVRAFAVSSGSERLDLEFAMSGGRLYLLQSRPITAYADPFAREYVFPLLRKNSNYFHGDENLGWAAKTLKKYDLPSPLFKSRDGEIFVSGIYIKRLVDKMRTVACSGENAVRFRRDFLFFLKTENELISTLVNLPLADVLRKLKEFNFKYCFLDYLHVSFQKNLENIVVGMRGGKWFAGHVDAFLPDRMFTAGKISGKFVEKYASEIYSGLSSCVNLAAQRMRTKTTKPRRGAEPCGYEKPLRQLVDLRDRIDYYYAGVSSVYHKIISVRTHYCGNISEICGLSLEDGLAVLGGAPFPRLPEPEKTLLRDFPLRGIPAFAGCAGGRAVIIRKLDDIKKVRRGDILVARYTRPDLMIGMVKAAGIVTACGGITSHAAIASRELKIPCLVGCCGCVDAVRDGDIVRIRSGMLYLVKAVKPRSGKK